MKMNGIKKGIALVFVVIVSLPTIVRSQNLIGEKITDYTFTDIINTDSATLSIANFRGKILILDFWSSYCAPCIASFPKKDAIARKYRDDVSLIKIAVSNTPTDREACRQIFNRHSKKYDLQLPCAFDTVMFRKLDFSGVGQSIVIGRDGTVLTTCLSNLLTDSVINRLVAGLPIDLPEAATRTARRSKSNALNANQYRLEDDLSLIRYKSILTKAQPTFPIHNVQSNLSGGGYSLKIFNFRPISMYKRGYATAFPSFRTTRISIETADPSRLKDSIYCFELIMVEPNNDIHPETLVRKELDRVFQVNSRIEKRVKRCLILTSDDTTRIATRGGQPVYDARNSMGPRMINQPISRLDGILENNTGTDLPFVNETGIKGHVDIELDYDFRLPKLERYRRALAPYGLELIEGDREIDVVVITDAT